MNSIIDKMATDLGIYRYHDEDVTFYNCRVIYSAMSCWVKAITMDQPVGSKENHLSGVSRRHIYERGNTILQSLIKMNPETSSWFNVEDAKENPIVIIRNRLLNHGDLLNEGYDTNLALSFAHKKQFIPGYDTIYGEILEKNIFYSGISALCSNNVTKQLKVNENTEKWLKNLSKKIWWSPIPSKMGELMYFNPSHKSRNNYTAWNNSLPDAPDEIILGRLMINQNSFEYYLLKPKSKLLHRLDPFLQEQGYHIRIMYELRKEANNCVVAIAKNFGDHIHLQLFTHLPTNEQIMLKSYAWPYNRINDMLCWTMYDYIWNYIKPHFESIGIRVVEE